MGKKMGISLHFKDALREIRAIKVVGKIYTLSSRRYALMHRKKKKDDTTPNKITHIKPVFLSDGNGRWNRWKYDL